MGVFLRVEPIQLQVVHHQ